MIFVSYSHRDEKWRKRFEIMSKPLSRSEGIKFWSDRDLKVGEWEPQIKQAMHGAVAAVLLVSDNFLASDFIIDKELSYLIRAERERSLKIVWTYLEPCDVKRHPQIMKLQAVPPGPSKALSKMTDWEWKETMLRGCGLIDEALKDLERPVINSALRHKLMPRISDRVPLLAKPARRAVEVLVYAGKKWWRQKLIKAGTLETKIFLGTETTQKGTEFTVCAITVEKPLTQQTYPNLPNYRTKSDEIVLVRN